MRFHNDKCEKCGSPLCDCPDEPTPQEPDGSVPGGTATPVGCGPSLGPVAYRHLHEDGYEYYDAPTGEDCEGCEPLYSADSIPALTKERDEAQESARDLCRILNEELCGRTFMGEPAVDKERTVKESVYLSAVKGRSDFRTAFREAREQIAALQAANESLGRQLIAFQTKFPGGVDEFESTYDALQAELAEAKAENAELVAALELCDANANVTGLAPEGDKS